MDHKPKGNSPSKISYLQTSDTIIHFSLPCSSKSSDQWSIKPTSIWGRDNGKIFQLSLQFRVSYEHFVITIKHILPLNSIFQFFLYQADPFQNICDVINPPLLYLELTIAGTSAWARGTKEPIYKYVTVTSKVSAALFKSRTPSSACLIKFTNFFVRRPEPAQRKK